MKLFMILILVSFHASASPFNPAKGDFALYERTADTGIKGFRKSKIESVDAGRDSYSVGYYTGSDEGSMIRRDVTSILGTSIRERYISRLSDSCSALSGAIERIFIPSGYYECCRVEKVIDNYRIVTWLGAGVPFGIIKETTFNLRSQSYVSAIELSTFGNE